jgi:hypothetical protein
MRIETLLRLVLCVPCATNRAFALPVSLHHFLITHAPNDKTRHLTKGLGEWGIVPIVDLRSAA